MSLNSYYHDLKTNEIITENEFDKRNSECFSPRYAYFGEYKNLKEAQHELDTKLSYLKDNLLYRGSSSVGKTEKTEQIAAILVERDYKGYYERFALTPEEFIKEYPEVLEGENPENIKNYLFMKESDSFTIQPLVHIWYQPTYVGDENWNTFFTDMSDGLSESDIEEGNLAYIREDLWQSLKQYMPNIAEPEQTGNLNITDLNRDQLIELKQAMYTENNEDVSWEELANVDELVSDIDVFERYSGVSFTKDDFSCSVQKSSLSELIKSANSRKGSPVTDEKGKAHDNGFERNK